MAGALVRNRTVAPRLAVASTGTRRRCRARVSGGHRGGRHQWSAVVVALVARSRCTTGGPMAAGTGAARRAVPARGGLGRRWRTAAAGILTRSRGTTGQVVTRLPPAWRRTVTVTWLAPVVAMPRPGRRAGGDGPARRLRRAVRRTRARRRRHLGWCARAARGHRSPLLSRAIRRRGTDSPCAPRTAVTRAPG